MNNNSSSKEKQLVKNTVLYSISNFGSKILTFLIVPLYTYYLSTSEYGTYDTMVSVMHLIAPLCILAVNEALLRWLLKSEYDNETIVGTGFSLYFGFCGITLLVMLIVFQFWAWQYKWNFVLILLSSTLQIVMQYTARGEKKNKAFAVSGVLYTIVMLGLNVILVIFLRQGIEGMLTSMTIAYLSSSLYLIIIMRNTYSLRKVKFNKKLAKEMLVYSSMLVPNNISWWVMNTSDRIMLTMMLGSSFTGIYSIACKFPTVVNVIHTLFYQAWQEQAVLEYDSETRDEYYTKIFNSYMKLAGCLVLLLIPFSKLVIAYLMDESYIIAYKYIGILYIGSLFSSFSGFYGTGYISAKDTKNAMNTTMIGALVNIAINIILMKSIGIWAACISTLFGYMVVWLIRVKQTKKYFTIKVNWKVLALLIALSTFASVMICYDSNILTMALLAIFSCVGIAVNKELLINLYKGIKRKVCNK